LDLVTLEGWSEGKFAEGVSVRLKNGRWERGRGRKNIPACKLCLFAEPIHQMDGGYVWCGRL